jgi:hypothetical protein
MKRDKNFAIVRFVSRISAEEAIKKEYGILKPKKNLLGIKWNEKQHQFY